MAATGRRERCSHSTDQLGSLQSEGTGGEGVSLSPTEQLGYGSSSSNLLEISDLAQVGANVDRPDADTICLGNPGRGIYQLQFKDDDSDVSSVSSAKSEKSSGSQGPTSASQVSDFTLESGGNVMSPTQSPPLQTMDRVGGYESYDPFRIPSAVFQRSRSTTPLEWSIASNESLFSIQVGNNSFSRDHVLMLSDLGKSGELTKSGELFGFSPPPSVITSRETEMKSAEYEEGPKMADTTEYNIKDNEDLIAEDLSDRNLPPPAVSWNSSSKSRHSDRSQNSSDSFAFPIKKKCACPSCYCSNCSRAFCYCLWPRCYPTWSSCCVWNCSRTFCYSWNCSRRGFCCHTSNILADEEAQGGSMSADAKFQGTPVSSKSKAKCWFPCCSCSCFKWICCSCSSCFKWSCCSCSCYKWSCSCPSCYKRSCCSCSFYKWCCCSCSSCCKWSCGSCSCCKWSCGSCSSCYKWSCGSCSSCCKWSCGSCSSCCKWSCGSSPSCCKWSCGSSSSCCKWNFCSCSSCWTWSGCSSCHFRHCCHFRPRCCFRPHCHIYPSCHFCRCYFCRCC